jgi:hypothetical protein
MSVTVAAEPPDPAVKEEGVRREDSRVGGGEGVEEGRSEGCRGEG